MAKAFRRHGDPRVITLDGFEPTHAALHRMGMNNEFNYRWEDAVQIRTCPYLNNVVEQIEHIGQRGRELFWQLPLFETHHLDLVTNFDIGVAGAIYAERRRSRLGFNKIWCMCRPAEFLQR